MSRAEYGWLVSGFSSKVAPNIWPDSLNITVWDVLNHASSAESHHYNSRHITRDITPLAPNYISRQRQCYYPVLHNSWLLRFTKNIILRTLVKNNLLLFNCLTLTNLTEHLVHIVQIFEIVDVKFHFYYFCNYQFVSRWFNLWMIL